MENYGLDNELGFEVEEENKSVVTMPETPEKPKRRPWYPWEVNGREYRLVLTTQAICALEDKFRKNLLLVVSELPPLGVMLTIIQGAAAKYEHGIRYKTVQDLYDAYLRDGGNQTKLFTDVIMGIMSVSGFFTKEQQEDMETKKEMPLM